MQHAYYNLLDPLLGCWNLISCYLPYQLFSWLQRGQYIITPTVPYISSDCTTIQQTYPLISLGGHVDVCSWWPQAHTMLFPHHAAFWVTPGSPLIPVQHFTASFSVPIPASTASTWRLYKLTVRFLHHFLSKDAGIVVLSIQSNSHTLFWCILTVTLGGRSALSSAYCRMRIRGRKWLA